MRVVMIIRIRRCVYRFILTLFSCFFKYSFRIFLFEIVSYDILWRGEECMCGGREGDEEEGS